MAVKLILDTDIGTDVDDAWALGLCLAADEIELLGVTLVHADLQTRARIALKFLKLAGRLDVPVYSGESTTMTNGAAVYWGGHEGTNTDFSDIAGLSALPGGVKFILDSVRKHPEEVCVCSIGPLTNLAKAISLDPQTMHKVRRLVAMACDFKGEGEGNASREHNASVDPAATRIVLESGIPATVVGLNVTMRVTITRKDTVPLRGWPLGDYLAAMSHQYFTIARRDVLYMHDPLAVASVIEPSMMTTSAMSASVLDDGRVVWRAGGPIQVCTDVAAERFVQLLRRNIYSLREQGD